ncbi:LPD38 domain-containing protein [Kushneria aurantia]|uniref:LPD38 domain-containing protein n=1 Tax=Kushneria aurantia TaxID=504092 RepID=A0ABV6G6I4_9GAMM|nr:LPD38 domain-containing protein [Kushneria aurantia]
MALIDDIRQRNPSLASRSDDEIKSMIRQSPEFSQFSDAEFDAFVTDGPQPEQSGTPGFTGGLAAGVDQLQAMGGGLVMAAGDALESEGMLDAGREIYQRNMDEAAENSLGYGFTDIRSPTDAWNWARFTAGNQLPMLAASLASGGAGGLIAGTGGRLLAGQAARQAAARIGQAVGAGVGSVGMETGALMGETEDLDVSLAHGALAGSLDAITPVRLLRAAGRGELADRAASEISDGVLGDLRRQAQRSTRQAARRGAMINMLTEASTEGLQGLIGQHANHWVDSNGESLLANLDEVDVKAIVDEAAAGGLMGGLAGAPAGLGERARAQRAVNSLPTDQQAGGGAAGPQPTPQGPDANPDPLVYENANVSRNDWERAWQQQAQRFDNQQRAAQQFKEQAISSAQQQAAAAGGDPLHQATAGLYAEQEAEAAAGQARTADNNRAAADLGNRIQLAMNTADDLAPLARDSDQARTRLRNMNAVLQRAEAAYADGNTELANRLTGRAEMIGNNLTRSLSRQGSRERPATGFYEEAAPFGGLLGQERTNRLKAPDPSIINMGGATADTTQYAPQARRVRRDQRMADQQQGAQRMREQAAGSAQITDQGVVYGQGPTTGNANTGMDQSASDPRFAPQRLQVGAKVRHAGRTRTVANVEQHPTAQRDLVSFEDAPNDYVFADEVSTVDASPVAQAEPALQYRSNGQPFPTERSAMASGVFQAARRRGEQVEAVPVDGGFAVRARPAQSVVDDQVYALRQDPDPESRAMKAMRLVIDTHQDVPGAVTREDLGDIDFVWGEEGGPVKRSGRRKGAYGVAHILEARQRKDGLNPSEAEALAANIAATVQNGELVTRTRVGDSEKARVTDGRHTAMLIKEKGNAWLLTGWEEASGESGKGHDNHGPTHDEPTPTRFAVGAEAAKSIDQEVESRQSGASDGQSEIYDSAEPTHSGATRARPDMGAEATPRSMARPTNDGQAPEGAESTAWQRAEARGLDMSQDGRMRRAREMGYIASIDEAITAEMNDDGKIARRPNTRGADAGRGDSRSDGRPPAVFYHGTADDIAAFQAGHPNRNDSGWLGHGIYVTNDPGLAGSYANTKAGMADPNVMPLVIKPKSLLRVNLEFKRRLQNAPPEATLAMTERLRAEGFDGAILGFPNRDQTSEIVLFNPEDIRSTQAAFDPEGEGSDDLLFSSGQSRPENEAPSADTIRQALTGLEGQLGDVTVVDSADQLPLGAQMQMLRDGVDAGSVRGLYSGDRLYLVASNNESIERAVKTAVHEAVGHKGLRGVLGDELVPVMRQLYKSLPLSKQGREALKEVLASYTHLDRDNPDDQVTIAEEMVAHLLEKGYRPKAWQRAVAKIRELARRLFPGMSWSYTDVLALGEKSRDYLRKQQAERNAEQAEPTLTRYSQRQGKNKLFTPIQQEAEAYRKALDKAVTSLKSRVGPVTMGRTPPVLAQLGAPDLPITIMRDVVRKATNGVKHDVEMETVAQLPELLHDPVAVFRSRTEHNALVSLVDATDRNGEPVVVALHLRRREGRLEVNRIASAYGMREGKVGSFVRDGLLAYLNENKNPDLVRLIRVQFPGSGSPNQGHIPSVLTPEDIGNPDIRYSLGAQPRSTADAFDDLTDAQTSALNKIAPRTPVRSAVTEAASAFLNGSAIAYFKEKLDGVGLQIRQGLVDRYAALKDMDMALNGEDSVDGSTASSSWVLARMSSAASGALTAMLNYGRIYLDPDQKVIDVRDDDSLGLGSVLARLGDAAEIERFMGWIAGNRSARLAAEGRENLFDAGEIEGLRTLNRGTMKDGRDRGQLYDEVFAEFQQYRDDVLAIAEQSGIISAENRAMWRDEFYVPFYRIAEEDKRPSGPRATAGLSRAEAYKKLKGGSGNLNDLLGNTMMNFHHLLQTSMKNQAAAQAMDNAEALGVATEKPEAEVRGNPDATFVLRNGQKVWYQIDDPLVYKAVSSLAQPGINTTTMKAMRSFKRVFTNLTTTTPQFVVANLLRDSMQAAATSPLSKNIPANLFRGARTYADKRTRARMMASGGSFSFGHIYGENADELKVQLTHTMRRAQLVRDPSQVPAAARMLWRRWNDATDFTENMSRAEIYRQNEARGKLYAAFQARDLMDFSSHGAWPVVRFLIDVVPFMNARLQGLDKIGRSGVAPALRVAMGRGSATDKQAAARFWSVTGSIAMASIALYLHNRDDEEYRKLEQWQRDSYWFFRIGDTGIFIPKPFEVGAIATLAERMTEQMVDDKATGELFAQRLKHMLTDTFSFSPVPQIGQPLLDVYSNYDAFTGRPIESLGMERLSPSLRTRSNTTEPARWISQASEWLFGAEGKLTVSPVQVDHMIQGYLGQVGAWGAGVTDSVWRAANGESKPARHWYEYQPVRRFYQNLGDEDRYTRYGTLLYDGVNEASRVYADLKEYRELGDQQAAMEVMQDNRELLRARQWLNGVKRRLTEIGNRMELVRRSDNSAEQKRKEMDRLQAIKNRLTEMAGKRIEEMRVKI